MTEGIETPDNLVGTPLKQVQESPLSATEKSLVRPLVTGEAEKASVPASPEEVGFWGRLKNSLSRTKQPEVPQKNSSTTETPGPTPQS